MGFGTPNPHVVQCATVGLQVVCGYLGIFFAIMSSENTESCIFSFLICMTFIPISCLAVLVRTSSLMLNKIGEVRHPCLVLIERNIPSFTIKYNVSYRLFVDACY